MARAPRRSRAPRPRAARGLRARARRSAARRSGSAMQRARDAPARCSTGRPMDADRLRCSSPMLGAHRARLWPSITMVARRRWAWPALGVAGARSMSKRLEQARHAPPHRHGARAGRGRGSRRRCRAPRDQPVARQPGRSRARGALQVRRGAGAAPSALVEQEGGRAAGLGTSGSTTPGSA